jgi:protein-tyrosine-phosphatase
VSESEGKQRVLFLCTHNSARSQMAEGMLRAYGAGRFEAFSAGTEATHVRPLAVRAMAELRIDISSQESKTLDRQKCWRQRTISATGQGVRPQPLVACGVKVLAINAHGQVGHGSDGLR